MSRKMLWMRLSRPMMTALSSWRSSGRRFGDQSFVGHGGIRAVGRDIHGEARLWQRDKLLLDSDWTQVTDSPLSDSDKAKWATYRQKLRDVPAQSDPYSVNWPAL